MSGQQLLFEPEHSVVRSVSESQAEILDAIERLHLPHGYECDLTYGNGAFWRHRTPPPLRYDIAPQVDGVTQADSTAIPMADSTLRSVVFDPPFLTYIRAERGGNGRMVMAQRFSGYWTFDQLTDHYVATLREAHRVLTNGGVLVFKCQDIVHNHRLHATHALVIAWATDAGFRLLDLFVLVAKHRLPAPNRAGKQRHARIFHSYFLVFRKVGAS